MRIFITSLKPRKSCGEDLIVSEIVQALEEDALQILLDIFIMRLLNVGEVGAEDVWPQHCVQLIQKEMGAIRLERYRPIALVSILYKIYSKFLGTLAGEKLLKLKAPPVRVSERTPAWRGRLHA